MSDMIDRNAVLKAIAATGVFGRTDAEKHASLEQYCACRDAILALPAASSEAIAILRTRVDDQATEIARLTRIVQMQPPAIKPAASAEDVRAGALKDALEAMRGAGSAGRTKAERKAALEQYCLDRDAILALIPGAKP